MNLTGERRARRIVARRSGGICEACDRRPAVDWHHRCGRAQGGRWCPSNGLHLCRQCHEWVTTHPTAAREYGWSVRRAAEPSRERVWLPRHGWALLSTAGDVTRLDRPIWDPYIGQPPEITEPEGAPYGW